MTESVIHLRVPAAVKACWVRESRAAGMRLSDWIVERVEMRHHVFDVTLYWHDGGSVFLGVVQALTTEEAGRLALAKYMRQSKAHEREIEEGGGFQLEAVMLPADEAVKWLSQNT